MEKRNLRKERIGIVLSNKMEKTVVVSIERLRHHPLYKKAVRRMVKYKVHDEKNECQPGDVVSIIETRPLSRDKRWRVVQVLSRGEQVEIAPEEVS